MKHIQLIPAKFHLILFIFLGINSFVSAQTETNPNVLVYDVVYMKDGRVLKGEIIIFEEKDGDITFKDIYGRKYSIKREEYNYFVEDKRFLINKNDTLVIRPRKEKELEISLGFNAAYLNASEDFKADDYYLHAYTSTVHFTPICFKFGIGKYINRQNFIGLSADVALATEIKSYFNVGLKYVHQYDAYKRNVSFYIPVELLFNNLNMSSGYQVNDPAYTSESYSKTFEVTHSFQSLGLNLGQGVSFILNNKKSVSMELSLFKNYVISHGYEDLNRAGPKGDFNFNGMKFTFFYNI